MRNKVRHLITIACLTIVLAAAAHAQIDAGWHYLYENGERLDGQMHY